MDLTASTEPRSDQQNFDDYAGGITRTVTITKVVAGTSEQPVEIHIAEFQGRPYKPSKSMRRVLVAAWGPDASAYTGRQITLYGDPSVKFGGVMLGGIKIGALSHIEKPLTLSLTATKGTRKPHTVKPLEVAAPTQTGPTNEQITASTDVDALKAAWDGADAIRRTQIEARVAELTAAPTIEPTNDQWDAPTEGAES